METSILLYEGESISNQSDLVLTDRHIQDFPSEGVSVNNCLQALDLKNNQISHDSAAELCRALKQNHTWVHRAS